MLECGGLHQVILCLGRDTNTAKAAVDLLFELLQDRSVWNLSVCKELAKHSSGILFLVTLLKGTVIESAEKARPILLKLCEDHDDNIVVVASAHWYKPLIDRFHQGLSFHRILQ